MKRILTSDDVLALVRRGETELVMGPEDRLTDLARELAQRRGVKLVDAAQAAAGRLPPRSRHPGPPRLRRSRPPYPGPLPPRPCGPRPPEGAGRSMTWSSWAAPACCRRWAACR